MDVSSVSTTETLQDPDTYPPNRNRFESPTYRLYKRRFVGLVALVLLNIVAGLSWPWFGPIANNMTADFDIKLDDVNWLGNILSCVFLPTSLLVPFLVSKYGIERCCQIGAVAMILSSWIRYAGTAHTLSGSRAYALLIIGQAISAVPMATYQVIGPKYSEKWFDLKGRTTATMIVSIANPIGGALGQLISPLVNGTRESILVLGIISTAAAPLVFCISNAPPTPPTYAGSRPPQSLLSLLRALAGKVDASSEAYIRPRSRIDFVLLTMIFGILVAAANAFSLFTAEIFEPVGYDATISGLLGACLLLTGIVAAIIAAPLFDRVFTHHLALTIKILVPPLAVAWFSLIWAVKPKNMGGLFAITALIGTISLTLLPVALELGADLTKNVEASSAILWCMGNLLGVIFVLVEQALRASPNASPPLNMRRALIFNAAVATVAAFIALPMRGRQDRKRLDELKLKESASDSGPRGRQVGRPYDRDLDDCIKQVYQ
ncbi:hypothetical protein APHAL10511_000184 [Amanita phalloides]|nr:hypothetical protein APHAL10511_000184 [Amanita phalloides]